MPELTQCYKRVRSVCQRSSDEPLLCLSAAIDRAQGTQAEREVANADSASESLTAVICCAGPRPYEHCRKHHIDGPGYDSPYRDVPRCERRQGEPIRSRRQL